MNPATGEVTIGRMTFGHSPSVVCFAEFVIDHFSTDQSPWVLPRAAPHNPPINAWLELDGSPNHHVARFQMIAPINAQKTMGIITLALFTGTRAGTFDHLPAFLHFLRMPVFEVPKWVVVTCALTMAAGTASGGWRIIRTLGHRMVRLQPVHGFAAETTAAIIIQTASHYGIPVSTTHVIASSIMGVGATKRFNAVKWSIVQRIVWAWVLTLPAAALMSYLSVMVLQLLGVAV